MLWLLHGVLLSPTVGLFAHHGTRYQGLTGRAGIVGADRYTYLSGLLLIPLAGALGARGAPFPR